MSSNSKPLESLLPTEPFEIENGLSLRLRVKLNLNIHPSNPNAPLKPFDEWQIKRALIDFLKTSLSTPITVPDEDVDVRKHRDLKKRKREEPVAHGSLVVRDLGFLKGKWKSSVEEEVGAEEMEKKFLDWRRHLLEKMDGLELNLEGSRLGVTASIPRSDDFESMKMEWEEFYAFGNRGYSRGGMREPDTIIMRGVPSRWFAEPRVSSKPSLLVTHTIFSTFGKIRHLDVAEDNDPGINADEDTGSLISGLHCKIVVQFEKHRDFYNTLKTLCSHSLQKEGSRLKVDYEVNWDKDGFFRGSNNQTQQKSSRMPPTKGQYRNEAPRHHSDNSWISHDDVRRKRFKE